jgi:transcriptional regulator with XRE-family HTH domain
VSLVSGPVLRLLRERAGLGLRAVARRTTGEMSLSDGHLSRVERGQRPVTPAIVAAYERALRLRITTGTVTDALIEVQADRADRRAFNTTLAGILLGNPPEHEWEDALLRAAEEALLPPGQVGEVDIAHVAQAAAMVRRLDLRFGGILAGHIGRRLLRWALPLRTASMTDHIRVRLHTALATLGWASAWAAFDAYHHTTARDLWTLALESAVAADQPDLCAHILADVAAWHNHQHHPTDSLHLIRLAHGDERTSTPLRAILHGIHAHTYATLGEADGCTEQITLAEDTCATVHPDAVPAWLDGWQPGHTRAVGAHAATTLALTTNDDHHLADATARLTRAIDELATTARTRALALTQTRLAALHLHTGNPDHAAHWLQHARTHATDLRSARLDHALTTLHTRLEASP